MALSSGVYMMKHNTWFGLLALAICITGRTGHRQAPHNYHDNFKWCTCGLRFML